MIVVHHLGISQSDRIVWLCDELDLPYEFKRYDRDPVTRLAPPEYRALTPFGTAPVITDGELVLGESAAIIEYVIDTYGDGRLKRWPGQDGYADYLFWFHFANGSLMPSAMMVWRRWRPCGFVAAAGPCVRPDRIPPGRLRLPCGIRIHRRRYHLGVSADDDAGVRPA